MKYILLFITILVFSCSPGTDEIKEVYKDRDSIVSLFTSKTVIRSRGQNIILFFTYQDNKTNRYYIDIEDGQYQFSGDSLEYFPDILQINHQRGTDSYKQDIIIQVRSLLTKMDELKIRDISSEMAGTGIGLKINMKSNAVILYVPDIEKVSTKGFKDYVRAMQKLDDHWYYTLKE